MSKEEMEKIAANFLIRINKEFNCNNCLNKYVTRPDMQHKHQEQKGCFSPRPYTVAKNQTVVSKPIEFNRCPANYFDGSVMELFNMHQEYEKGHLYFEGPPNEQPAKYFEIMSFIDNLIGEDQAYKQERIKRLNRARNGK